MNDTQRLIFRIVAACIKARQVAEITVPPAALELLERELLDGMGMYLPPKETLERCKEIKFAGVTIKAA